jgi:hypothetical protein
MSAKGTGINSPYLAADISIGYLFILPSYIRDCVKSMNVFEDRTAVHIIAFTVGFVIGAYVLANEMVFLGGNMITYAFFHALPATLETNPILSSYTTGVEILTIVGIIQGILIGIFLIESFSMGYIFGDVFLMVFLGKPLWVIAPSVIIGMVVAVIAVLIGVYIRVLLKNRRHNHPRYKHSQDST